MKYGWLAVLLVAGLAGWSGGRAWAEEKDEKQEVKVKLEECPKAVQETLKKEAGAGKIEEIEKETEDGKTIYEADVEIDGKDYELKIAEDGKLIAKKLEADEKDKDGKDEGKDKHEDKQK